MNSENSKSEVLDKGLWGMARPLLVEQFVLLALPLVDTIFLSVVSDNAVAAVGTSLPLLVMCFELLVCFGIGGASVAGQYIGRGDYRSVSATFSVYLWILLIVGMIVSCFVYFFGPAWTQMIDMSPAEKPLADTYIKIFALVIFINAIRLYFQTILNSFGKSNWVMYATGLMALTNILMNSVFVFGLFGVKKMGVEGVAYASIIASLLGMFLLILFSLAKVKIDVPLFRAVSAAKTHARAILRIGFFSFLEPASFYLSLIAISTFVTKLGAVSMASRVYVVNLFQLAIIFNVALAIATQYIVVQLLGKKDYSAVKQQYRDSVKNAVLSACIVSGLVFIFKDALLSGLTSDGDIIALASTLITISLLTEPARSVNVITGFTLRATGDALYLSISAAITTWLVTIPLIFLAVNHWGMGLVVVWCLLMADEYVRAVINYKRWLRGKWKNFSIEDKAQCQTAT